MSGVVCTPLPSTTAALDILRAAIDGDKRRLCDALGMHRDGDRWFCHNCQNDGKPHADGDFSTAAGFKCHRCGWSGDGLALVRLVKKCDFPEALDFARSVYHVPEGTARTRQTTRKAEKGKKTHRTIDDAVRAAAWGVEQSKGHKWIETRRDMYRDAEARDFMAAIRFEREDGKQKPDGKPYKEPRPIHAVKGGWKIGRPPGKALLFRLPELLQTEGAVYLVEGEPAACAGAEIGLTCTTWPFGKDGIGKVDFSPLAGRDVILLPDNDTGGRKAMQKVAAILAALDEPARVRIVKLPDLPPKGDLVDFIAARADR